jgi:hypothetical protein
MVQDNWVKEIELIGATRLLTEKSYSRRQAVAITDKQELFLWE